MGTPDFDLIRDYVAELDGPVPYVSRSHETLGWLYRLYGAERIDAALAAHWAAQRADGEGAE